MSNDMINGILIGLFIAVVLVIVIMSIRDAVIANQKRREARMAHAVREQVLEELKAVQHAIEKAPNLKAAQDLVKSAWHSTMESRLK